MKTLINMVVVVILEMLLSAGSAISIFNDMAVRVNQAPEPARMVMIGLAMLALSVLGRKLKNK